MVSVEEDIVGLEIGNDSAIVAEPSSDDPASYRMCEVLSGWVSLLATLHVLRRKHDDAKV